MMASWDKKYFVTDLVNTNMLDAPWNPDFSAEAGTRLLAMDSRIKKGAFYMELAWFWPGKWPAEIGTKGTVKPHDHPFDEAIAFVGTNFDEPYSLGGEVELWVDGKQNILDRSFVAFIPAGIVHCPLRILKIERPIFHFTAGMGHNYNLKKARNEGQRRKETGS